MIPMKMALMKFEGHNIIRKIVAKVVLFSKFLSNLVQTMYDYDIQLEKGMCSNVCKKNEKSKHCCFIKLIDVK